MPTIFNRQSLVLAVIVALLFGCSESAGDGISRPLSRLDTIEIEVTGDNFQWHFRYPGLDGLLGTDDDKYSTQDLFLPDQAMVKLMLKSKDYLYSFALPELGLKEIAVPELDFELQFKTGNQQTLKLMGDQFCGYAHTTLIGKVYIRNQDHGFYGWSNS